MCMCGWVWWRANIIILFMAQSGKKESQLVGTLSTALNPLLRNLQNDSNALQLPQLALRCAQFFHSLSQYCLQYYRNDQKQKEMQKTKNIKKEVKEMKEKGQRGRKKKDTEREDAGGNEKTQPPRKPLTAYIIYFQDKKQHFVERYPTLNLSELTKLIAKDWKELSDKERQVFLDRAADDRRRYDEQIQEFKRLYGRNDRNQAEEEEHAIDLDEEQQVQQIIAGNPQIDILDAEIDEQKEEKIQLQDKQKEHIEAEVEGQEGDSVEGERSSEEEEGIESEKGDSSQSVQGQNEKEE